jgi:hypothetical protein
MVLASTATRDFAVAYLPDNPKIEIDLSTFPSPLSAQWFDPIKNNYEVAQSTSASAGVHGFTPPRPGDWVLLLKQR